MIFTIIGSDGTAGDVRRDTYARFTKFDVKYKRLEKEYTTSDGKTIIYGQRSSVETIDFTMECNQDGYDVFMPILEGSYQYTIKYSFDDTKTFEELSGKEYFLSSDLTKVKVYNAIESVNHYDNNGLFTISGTFEEV